MAPGTRSKFKPQYRRLLAIDQALQQARYPNCSTLATDLEVSAKTVQRDIDYLRDELEAPIAYDDLRHGFFYTEARYRLPAIDISESDLFAVCIAERALTPFRGTPLHGRLAEVFARIQDSLPERVSIRPEWIDDRITFLPEAAPRISAEVWDTLAGALREDHRVRIRHTSPARGTSEPRVVDPYALVSHKGQWYLIGRSHHHDAVRTFAVSRIEAAERLDEAFGRPARLDVRKLLGDHFGIMWGERAYAVHIRFAPRVAPYIAEREWHPTQSLQRRRDGSLDLRFTTNHLLEVKDWVLSWGPGAQVLRPRSLAADVAADHHAAAALYGKPAPARTPKKTKG